MGLKQQLQFKVIVYDLAKSLASMKNAPWEKVKVLNSYCPQLINDRFIIWPYSLDCIIALGTYYIESEFSHTEKIVPYLLNLLNGLTLAKWCDDDVTETAYAEKFAFCVNTLLSEVSYKVKKDIFTFQTNEIVNIYTNLIIDLKNGFDNADAQKRFYNIKLPIFLGLMQSMTRYDTQNKSFFCHLFPKYKDYVAINHHIKAIYESPHINLVSMVCKQASEIYTKSCSHIYKRQCCDYAPENFMNVVEMVHSLLSNEMLKLFEERLSKVTHKHFYYLKNFEEILKCAALILYRDVLYQSFNLTALTSSIKKFIDLIYLSTQKYSILTYIQTGKADHEENLFQNLKVNVLTKIMCLELLASTTKDLSDAEHLCAHVTTTLKYKHTDKSALLIEAPYTVTCMNVLGTLADQFPVVSDACVKAMQDFLSSPSSTLINLCTDQSEYTEVALGNKKLVSKAVWFEYCIFQKIQNSAIENLCSSLKSTYCLDQNYIPAFLTKFSSLLFMEKHHPHYEVIIENVVVTLGHISYSIPTLSLSILQCFQQRLCRHSIESDVAIIHQLGNMLIYNGNMDVILGALKIFSNLMQEVISDVNKELQHISKTLFHVLFNVAERLHEEDKINALFFKSLEIFVQTGLDWLRSSEDLQVEEKNITNNHALHLVGLLSMKLRYNSKFKKQQELLFQNFWLYFVLSSKESVIMINNNDLNRIVQILPTLTSESLTDHELREFFYSSSLNKMKIPAQRQIQLKTFILDFLMNTTELYMLVNKLTFSQTVYILSICALEKIRIENSDQPSIEYLFCYLTNLKLQKDKYGTWQCICKVVEEIFKRFLNTLLQMERNDARELVLEKQVLILLINFNNIHSEIRRIADKFLSELIDVFPHLLWNRRVIWSVLDIVAVLQYSLIIESNEHITSLKVPNTDYDIALMDTKKSREDVFYDFVARSKEIICEARKWAPTIVNLQIQEYITQNEYLFPKIDPISQLRRCTWTLICLNEKSLVEMSEVITSMTIRSRFIGEVAGLIEKSSLPPISFGKSLADEVWSAVNQQDLTSYQIGLQRAAAFAITQRTLQYEIKKVLVGSFISFFTEETISTAVHCWNWLCTVHSDFELEVLMEIFETWQYTIDSRMGLFSVESQDNSEHKVLSLETESGETAVVENSSRPHNIWLEFITLQISSSKYANQNKLELIINFLHKTLPMNIGGSDCVMSRSVEYIVARFSLLSSALSLLQYNIPISIVDLIIIRQRIYLSCLDFFCCVRQFPKKNSFYIKQKIDVLVKFWNIVYSDKKHILKQCPNRVQDEMTHNKEKQYRSISWNSIDNSVLYDSFSIDILKKRKMALCLLAEEIEFLSTWCDPLQNDGIDKIRHWQANLFSPNRSLSEFSKTAWNISPILAVYLPIRLRRDERITSEISKLILQNPAVVLHIPHAMMLLANVEHVQKDSIELTYLLTWAKTGILPVLSLLSKNYPPHPIVLQFVVKTLLNVDVNILINYIPQLVQSLRYDSLDYIYNFLLQLCKTSQLFCHQMIWNIKANMYSDVNMTVKSPLFDKLNSMQNEIINNFSEQEKTFYEREFQFIDQITDVSCKIPRNLKRDEKKEVCLNALKSINIWPGCYLPSSPNALICEIDYKSGTPLQSKARTPYLANFLVYKCSYSEVLDIGMEISRKQLAGVQLDEIKVDSVDLDSYPKIWQRTIFKAADDVRQDILALQTIRYLKNVFKGIGLDVFLFPYKVVAVAPGMGVIECIPNANSRDQLGKQTNVGLYDYFVTTFGDEKSARFQEAQKNFIKSVAAYSIVIFLLQIKDRHNGNIMVDDEGHIIHIDFGFMFEISPGGNLGFEPDMKLTEEMVMIMGGGMESEQFKWFTELCIKAYMAARCHQEEIITFVTLMLDSGLPCFRGQTIKGLRGRFAPNASDREAANYITTVIRNSCLNFRTVTYDMLQYLQNSIQY